MENAGVHQEPLYMKSPKTGKIKVYHIGVTSVNGHGQILTKTGLVGGKLKTHPKTIKVGKNIGKSNATTPFEQACLEAKAKWTKKKKKG